MEEEEKINNNIQEEIAEEEPQDTIENNQQENKIKKDNIFINSNDIILDKYFIFLKYYFLNSYIKIIIMY